MLVNRGDWGHSRPVVNAFIESMVQLGVPYSLDVPADGQPTGFTQGAYGLEIKVDAKTFSQPGVVEKVLKAVEGLNLPESQHDFSRANAIAVMAKALSVPPAEYPARFGTSFDDIRTAQSSVDVELVEEFSSPMSPFRVTPLPN
ncbi:MAG: hypothetical protein M3N08_10140, partial [Pseudomonadota bacterium]|nr:hypothetical protein [Pseudomonadota bacterium]